MLLKAKKACTGLKVFGTFHARYSTKDLWF